MNAAVPLSRSEAQETKLMTARKRPRAPRKKPRKIKSALSAVIPWGDEEHGKNPLTEYVPLAAELQRSEVLERAYKRTLELRKKLSRRVYNQIQCARLHWDKYQEFPPGIQDLLSL